MLWMAAGVRNPNARRVHISVGITYQIYLLLSAARPRRLSRSQVAGYIPALKLHGRMVHEDAMCS